MGFDISQICLSQFLPFDFPWTGRLSTYSALLIASGRVDSSTREGLLRRLTSHGIEPASVADEIFNAHTLREYVHNYELFHERQQHITNPVVSYAVTKNMQRIHKKIDESFHSLIAVLGTNESFLSMRKSRKQGTHLSIEQCKEIFHALKFTPTSGLSTTHMIDKFIEFHRSSKKPSQLSWRNNPATQMIDLLRPQRSDANYRKFANSSELLLYIAGKVYDRITSSPAWQSEYFSYQTSLLNMDEELAHIATDVYSLDSIYHRVKNLPHDHVAEFQEREHDLNYIWERLCSRVSAFTKISIVLEHAEKELHIINSTTASLELHNKIDELIARQSLHEFKIDTADHVSNRFTSPEQQLETYRQALSGSIEELKHASKNP